MSTPMPHRVIEEAWLDLEGIKAAIRWASMLDDTDDEDSKALSYLADGLGSVIEKLQSIHSVVFACDKPLIDAELKALCGRSFEEMTETHNTEEAKEDIEVSEVKTG